MMRAGWRRWGMDALMVALALAAMLWMARHTASYDDNRAPFYVRGTLGETVRGRDFAVTVEKVELARALRLDAGDGDPPRRRDTYGVWLVAHLRVEALQQPLRFQRAELRTPDGTYYEADDRRVDMDYRLGGVEIVPGLPQRGVVAFEIPREKLAGTVLEASRDRFRIAPDSVAEIDLGLTRDRVDGLLRDMPESLLLVSRYASR